MIYTKDIFETILNSNADRKGVKIGKYINIYSTDDFHVDYF